MCAEGVRGTSDGDLIDAEGHLRFVEGDLMCAEGVRGTSDGDLIDAEGHLRFVEGHLMCAEGDLLTVRWRSDVRRRASAVCGRPPDVRRRRSADRQMAI
jgi:hypothetical protein